MKKTLLSSLLSSIPFVLLVAAGGCSTGANAKPGEKAAEVKAAPAAAQVVKIEKLGLRFDGPGDCSVSEMLGSQMVQCPNMVLMVGPPEADEKTLADAKDAAKNYEGSTFTKEEKTADGWNLQFHNKGSIGDNYFVRIRRSVGGKTYDCTTTAQNAEQAAAVEKACLNLAKI
jgi:hypothetical protein